MRTSLLACLFVAFIVGCGDVASSVPHAAEAEREAFYDDDASSSSDSALADEVSRLRQYNGDFLARHAEVQDAGKAVWKKEADRADEAPPNDVRAARKIIYRAQLDLVVKDFAEIESAAPQLVREHGGYLADLQLSRNSGDNRSGKWIARVPVAEFDAFLADISKLGVPERRQQSGQDVTAEFVDLEARLAAKKKFEARLLKLVEDRTDGVKDLIEVERELSRVRSEIEQMEGRRRFLVNQTSLTTVTVCAREERDYTPPEAPGLGGRIVAAWSGSIDSMAGLATNAIVAAVSVSPWLMAIGGVVAPAWMWRRGVRTEPKSK